MLFEVYWQLIFLAKFATILFDQILYTLKIVLTIFA